MSDQEQLNVEVEFGQVTFGENVARLGVKIPRTQMASDDAEKFFCGSRLAGEIKLETSAQPELPDMPEVEPITNAFDVRAYGANKKNFSCGMAFNVKDVNVELLVHFANQKGRMNVKRLGDMPEKRGGKPKEDAE